jgi:hypothetical protein
MLNHCDKVRGENNSCAQDVCMYICLYVIYSKHQPVFIILTVSEEDARAEEGCMYICMWLCVYSFTHGINYLHGQMVGVS